MGRPRRRTGHLAGTFAPPDIRPNQELGRRGPSLSQPLCNQPLQTEISIPIRQGHWSSDSPQYGGFAVNEPCFTPSTTDALSPVSSRATLSPGSTSAASSYTVSLENARHLSPEVGTPTSSIVAISAQQPIYNLKNATRDSLHYTAHVSAYILTADHAMKGKSHVLVLDWF